MSFDTVESSTCQSAPFELYWFTMAPGFGTPQNWYFCSGDAQQAYMGNTYMPATISRTEVAQDPELQSGDMSITVPNDSAIAQIFAAGATLAPVALTVYKGHIGDSDVVVEFSGKVATADFENQCTLHCLPDQQAIRKKIPAATYQTFCNRVLYSASCGIPVGGWTGTHSADATKVRFTATIADISADRKTLTLSGGTFDDSGHYWSTFFATGQQANYPSLGWGFIILPSGQTMLIINHSVWNQIILKAPLTGAAIGASVLLNRGCSRTWPHCQFLNQWKISPLTYGSMQTPKFLGFDLIPAQNPFNGVA